MNITKEQVKKIISDRSYNTPVGQEVLYRMYYLKFGIGFEDPTDTVLEERIYELEQLSDYGIAQLSGEWQNYFHYRIDKRKNKDLSFLRNLSYVGWSDETWFLIHIYSKEEIPSLVKFYAGIKRYLNTDIENIFDENLNEILPKHKRDIEYIKNRKFELLSENLQKIFKGENIPLEKLTDYEVKLLKTALWLDQQEQDENKKYFNSVSEIYNSML